MYTAEQIEQARRNQHRIQRATGERVFLEDGAMDLKMDARLFHNARISEQQDHGVENCWAEKEFVEDMKRRHPEIAVKSRPRKLRFAVGGGVLPDSWGQGRLTRFGRTTFHKSYG
jgi:hypothetical protein